MADAIPVMVELFLRHAQDYEASPDGSDDRKILMFTMHRLWDCMTDYQRRLVQELRRPQQIVVVP